MRWLFAVLACGPLGCSQSCNGSGGTGSTPQARPSPSCVVAPQGEVVGAPPVRVETVVSGLEVPWSIAFLPGAESRALVTERPGRVRLVRGGVLQPSPVLQVPVTSEGEGGLLGLAVHPDFARTRWIFVYYTTTIDGSRRNRVERWTLAEDAASAKPDLVILDGIPGARLHDGGRLRFGPDGMLYVATGDAKEPELAQDRRSLAGKLLRVTADGAPAPGNPWPNERAWLLGVRNVQAFNFLDANTIVVVDHGPSGELGRSDHDEVSVATKGANLGWPSIWGCEAREGMVSPILTWSRAVPPGGATYYRGDAIPAWKDGLLVAGLGSRDLHRVVLQTSPPKLVRDEVYFRGEPPNGYGRLRDVVTAPDGSVWLTTSNCDGRGRCPPEKDKILRLVAR